MTANCRFCEAPLSETFVDLGSSPLSNSYLAPGDLSAPETYFPLRVYTCSRCLLVQLPEHERPSAIFTEYAYVSSYSATWLDHCERYAKRMIDQLALDAESLVLELGSNDGCLLQYFRASGIPVLGIEPAANVALLAHDRGVPTEIAFFGRETARRLAARDVRPRLVVANNVLAHVPDLNDFVGGLELLTRPGTLITIECPHLLRLISDGQFDTIYHEHYSYFSLLVIERVMEKHGLRVHDVQELPTHGGSLRVFVSRSGDEHPISFRVDSVRAKELAAGLDRMDIYRSFSEVAVDMKCDLLEFLLRARREGRTVVGYGAPAKGNTLLNYCGIGPELIPFTVDRNPLKQGCYLPGSRIPIVAPDAIFEARPDYVLILPWNIQDEVMGQTAGIREWGGRFVVPVPRVAVLV